MDTPMSKMSPYELGLTGDSAAIGYLIRYLESGTANERRLAASAVGKLAQREPEACEEATDALVGCLGAEGPQVRQYALKAIAFLKPTPHILARLRAIAAADPKEYNRDRARQTLHWMEGSSTSAQDGSARCRKAEIQRICRERRIGVLLHFTPIANLPTILTHGLLPRTEIEARPELRAAVVYNDPYRADHQPDAVSLSLSFPNYQMFYFCRNHRHAGPWVVIGVAPRVLWERDCAFHSENAAAGLQSMRPLEERRQSASFTQMFSDFAKENRIVLRASLGIPDSYPTHPQAEVLVIGGVPRDRVIFACFEREADKRGWLAHHPRPASLHLQVDDFYFRPRCDYVTWSPARI